MVAVVIRVGSTTTSPTPQLGFRPSPAAPRPPRPPSPPPPPRSHHLRCAPTRAARSARRRRSPAGGPAGAEGARAAEMNSLGAGCSPSTSAAAAGAGAGGWPGSAGGVRVAGGRPGASRPASGLAPTETWFGVEPGAGASRRHARHAYHVSATAETLAPVRSPATTGTVGSPVEPPIQARLQSQFPAWACVSLRCMEPIHVAQMGADKRRKQDRRRDVRNTLLVSDPAKGRLVGEEVNDND